MFPEISGLMPPNLSASFRETESFRVLFTPRHIFDPDQFGNVGPSQDNHTSESGDADWTMVYDEGIDWKHKGKQYFSYFKYTKLATPHNSSTLKIEDRKIRSYCTMTMIGWWSNPLQSKGENSVGQNETFIKHSSWWMTRKPCNIYSAHLQMTWSFDGTNL